MQFQLLSFHKMPISITHWKKIVFQMIQETDFKIVKEKARLLMLNKTTNQIDQSTQDKALKLVS